MARARDDIFTMSDLRGKKIGLTKSLNTVKNDWWRIQEHAGIELVLRMNGMSMADVEIVEFPYPDDWYDKPEMLQVNMNNPSELWLRRDHKHDLAFRPLETSLENGAVDAVYTQSKVFQHLQEATGKFKAIEDLSRRPDWTLQMANCPAVITCTDVMAAEHPELVVAYIKAMIKVGRWANEHKHAAAILNRQTFSRDMTDAEMPPEVRSLGRMLRRWRDHIVAWHQARVTNGPTEAINNLIKRIKRIGFGLRRFRVRVLLYAGKPNWDLLATVRPR